MSLRVSSAISFRLVNQLRFCRKHVRFGQLISSCRFSSIMASAIQYKEYGDPTSVLSKVAIEIPTKLEKSQILVELLAAPINPADINTLQGIYGLKPPLPAVPGLEGVARVVKVADDVKDLKEGDWVIPGETDSNGTWASHSVWPRSKAMKIANDIPLLVAATISVNPCSAYRMLKDFVPLQPGDAVIQNGANSGVGQAVIQIARQMGIVTINVVRARPELEVLKKQLQDLGADYVVTEDEVGGQEFAANVLKTHTPKLALNCVGGKSATGLLRTLTHGGTMVTYGAMSKQPVTVATTSLIFKDVRVRGFWMTQWKMDHPDSGEWREMIEFLCDLARQEKLLPPLCNQISLDDYKSGVQKTMEGFTGKKQIFVMAKTES